MSRCRASASSRPSKSTTETWPTTQTKMHRGPPTRPPNLGDVIKPAGNLLWMQVTLIHEIPETSPEWERKLGNRLFLLAPIDGANKVMAIYDGFDQGTVLRRID